MTALDNPLDNPGVTYAMTVAVDEAVAERVRQDARWGREFPGRPHSHWLAILTEEVGEAAEAVCQTDTAHVAVHVAGQCSEQPSADHPDAVHAEGRFDEVTCVMCRVRWRGHLARGGQQTLEGSA